MQLNVQDDDQRGRFIQSVQKTDPEIADQCIEVINQMALDGKTLVPITRIKRLAREGRPEYQEAMRVAVAVAECPLISSLSYGSVSKSEENKNEDAAE